MIDRSESHLIARERRNRTTDPETGVVRPQRFATNPRHTSTHSPRIEPTVGSAERTAATQRR